MALNNHAALVMSDSTEIWIWNDVTAIIPHCNTIEISLSMLDFRYRNTKSAPIHIILKYEISSSKHSLIFMSLCCSRANYINLKILK